MTMMRKKRQCLFFCFFLGAFLEMVKNTNIKESVLSMP